MSPADSSTWAAVPPAPRTAPLPRSRPHTAYHSYQVETAPALARPRTRSSMGAVFGYDKTFDPNPMPALVTLGLAPKDSQYDLYTADYPDVFTEAGPSKAPQHHRRYSAFTQSFLNGVSELRSLTRRLSLSVKNKIPAQSHDGPENRRPQFASLKSGSPALDLTETTSSRPKSRGNLLRRASARRRPSLPLLNFRDEPEPPQEVVGEPGPAWNRGMPILSDLVYGGAGARASAAAQNERMAGRLQAHRATPLPPYEPRDKDDQDDQDGELGSPSDQDAESGIGIELHSQARRASSPALLPIPCRDPAKALATELVEQIFSYLDVESLAVAALVSRKWHDLSLSQAVWRDVFYREYGSQFPHPLSSGPPHANGLGKNTPGQDFRKLFQIRTEVDKRWRDGKAAAIYLNGHKDSVYCAQFDEQKIITGSRDNCIRVWDAHTYQCTHKLGPPDNPRERQRWVQHPIEPQGVLPFCINDVTSPDPPSNDIQMWHQASVLCLQYDEEILVTGSSDFSALVWSIKDNYQPLFRLVGHSAGVLDVCIDKQHIYTCSKDTSIRVWDRFTGQHVRTLLGHRGPVNAVQVRGNLLASASGDGMSKLWRLEDGVCIKEFHSKDRGLACVEFSPNGRTIFAGGNDRVIYEYDTVTGNKIRELKGHGDLVRSLHLDSANSRIVSGSYDHSIKVWDAVKGQSAEDGGLKINFEGWTSSWILAAKSNYRKIVCTSQDGRVVVIDFGYGINGVDLVEGS